MAFRLSELAARLGLEWEGSADPLIVLPAGFTEAGPGAITFAEGAFETELGNSGAVALILRPGIACDRPVLRAEHPRAAFTRILALFAPDPGRIFPAGCHPSAVIDPEATLGPDVRLGPGAVVGRGARLGRDVRLGPHAVVEADAVLGDGCVLYAGALVRERCVLGARVVLHPGAVVGSDGFGYHPGPQGLVKIPQIGIVVLEDDVEVGANTCIDRATTGETRVGAGTKLDNLVQVAHNVLIGSHTAVSAQCGISGSCVVGRGVILGGQVGVADHLELGDGCKVAAKSGITRDVPAGQSVFGYPAVEFRRGFKLVALTHKLPELFKRLARLERLVGSGQADQED
jgi:UDP-3-O-[3-hydroxymyristoyl] glucosamine N-acyltransferase